MNLQDFKSEIKKETITAVLRRPSCLDVYAEHKGITSQEAICDLVLKYFGGLEQSN